MIDCLNAIRSFRVRFSRRCASGKPLAALIGALWLAGCAAPAVKGPTDEELNTMTMEILTDATYLQAVLSRCGAVSPELKGYAQDLRDIWMYTHGDALAGADVQYSRSLADSVVTYENQRLALTAVRFKHQQQARAAGGLRLKERSANNRRLVCERRFGEMEQQLTIKDYLNPESERDLLVHETLLGMASEPVTMAEVPTLAGGVPFGLEPGRSYRQVEQEVANTCPDAELVVIRNNWPHEAYGIYCGEQSQSFLVCEWGECRAP